MRPSPDELITSLRRSLTAVVLPSIEDRWARYVATSMDLLLEHLSLRLTRGPELEAQDSADMTATLLRLGSAHPTVADLVLADEPPAAVVSDPEHALAHNEALRAKVVRIITWLDTDGPDPADRETIRAELDALVRRQVDRNTELTRPLFMSFGPTA